MNSVRFGDIGVIYGPKEKAQKLLDSFSHRPGGIYYAENWSPAAKEGDQPVFAYVTEDHLKGLNGEKPDFSTLNSQYVAEYHMGSGGSGTFGSGHEYLVSNARSGKGLTRMDRLSYMA